MSIIYHDQIAIRARPALSLDVRLPKEGPLSQFGMRIMGLHEKKLGLWDYTCLKLYRKHTYMKTDRLSRFNFNITDHNFSPRAFL